MTTQEFDLERRRELQAALSALTTTLWSVEPATAQGSDSEAPAPIDLDKPLRQLLKAAGYPAEVSRRALATLNAPAEEPEADPQGEVKRALRAAGYPAQVVHLVEALGDETAAQDAVKAAVKAAGYPADAARRVLMALEPPTEEPDADPQSAAKRALRTAGYPADVVRLLEAFKDHDSEPRDAVRAAVKAAGYPGDAVRRVLVALEPVEDSDSASAPDPDEVARRALRTAGYPADVVRLLEAFKDDDSEPRDAVRAAVKAAGYPPEVSRRVLAALEPPADDSEVDARADARRAVRAAGYPVEVVRLMEALGDDPDPHAALKNALRAAGYPAEVSRSVLLLLERYGDTDDPAEKARLRDVVGLVGAAGGGPGAMVEPVGRALRAAGYRPDLVELISVLLGRYGNPELSESGLRLSDLQAFVQQTGERVDAQEPVRRILRVAGYRTDLINLVGSLLERYGGAEAPAAGARIRDLADLVADADDDLLSLMRHWRAPATDTQHLGHELVTLLGRRGIDLEAARDLAAAVTNDPGEGRLKELARVARFALTAEDACISMAEPAWLEEPRFAAAYAEAKRISAWGRDIRWRVQTLVKLAAAASHLEGDFVECGVDTGGTARAVMAYLGDEAFKERTFYLFDTFRGLVPEQLLPDEPAPIEDRYPDVAAVARANFADKAYARIVEGTVPETLASYDGSRVAFLHIDMNAAYPEVEAFRHFWHLLAPGAPVVFDDYGFPRHRAQRRALDEAADALDVEIMMLPTCQGIVFKPPIGV